jgi:hypothetical protein
MRYFYTVILHISGLYKIEEERTHFGPTVAVIMFLILSISFVLKSEPRFYLLSTGSILITTSFAYSFFLIIKKYKKAQFNN